MTPKPENLAKLVHSVRGEKVLLDSDLADLYGVEARVLNQSVARNRTRFPDDFMFQLTAEEWTAMRSQVVTASSAKGGKSSQTVTSPPPAGLTSQTVMSNGRGGRRTLPFAFTEQGDEQFSQVFDAIKQLITDDQERKAKPKRRIGFL